MACEQIKGIMDNVAKQVIQVDAQTQNAVTEINKLTSAQKDLVAQVEKGGVSMTSFLKAGAEGFATFGLAMGGVQQALGLLHTGMDALKDVDALHKLEAAVPTKVFQELDAATDGLYKRQDLLRFATKALTNDLHLTGAQMGDVLNASRVLADRGYGSLEEISDKLLHSMVAGGRGMAEFGITLDDAKGKAEKVSEALGKLHNIAAGSEISEESRALAELNRMLEGVADTTKEMLASMVVGIRDAIKWLIHGDDVAKKIAAEQLQKQRESQRGIAGVPGGGNGEYVDQFADVPNASNGLGQTFGLLKGHNMGLPKGYNLRYGNGGLAIVDNSGNDEPAIGFGGVGRDDSAIDTAMRNASIGDKDNSPDPGITWAEWMARQHGGSIDGSLLPGNQLDLNSQTPEGYDRARAAKYGVAYGASKSWDRDRSSSGSYMGTDPLAAARANKLSLDQQGNDSQDPLAKSKAGFEMLGAGVQAGLEAAIVGGQGIGKAAEAAGAAVLRVIAQQAQGKAAWELAEAAGSFALGDFASAAQHTAAFALYEAAALGAGALASSMGSSGGSSGSKPGAVAGGFAPVRTNNNAANKGDTYNINLINGFYGEHGKLTQEIAQGVSDAKRTGKVRENGVVSFSG
jgi:hypothetical protein